MKVKEFFSDKYQYFEIIFEILDKTGRKTANSSR